MAVEPRAALDRLTAALEAHFEAITTRRSDNDPRIDDDYDVLADAFDLYDEALAREYSEVTPFMLVDDEHDDDDDDDLHELHDDDDEAELIVIDDADGVTSTQAGGRAAPFGYDA